MLSDEIERDRERIQREVLTRHVLDALRGTIQLSPETERADADEILIDVRAEFTDASAALIAPLVEAVQILESIIWASDGCMGHRDCAHSMEPWQRARALLKWKWDAGWP